MDKRTRTLNQAHARIDDVEKDVIEMKTEMKIQHKDLYNRVKRMEAIMICITGASLLLLLRMTFLSQAMDPVSCVALATGAYKTLRAAISTGKDLQEMSGTLSQWGKAFSDFSNLEEREKNPPFWKKTFKGSDEETALEIFAQKKKMEQMRAEIKDHISWNYGPSAWKEVLAIEADMRRRRKQEAYRKQEQIDNLINFAIGAVIFVLSGGILFIAFYFLGKWQGRW